jgi:Restriction endonuclease
VPKRSNLFQDVVGIIYRHMAGDARVKESAMLTSAATGDEREVDVLITTNVAGHDVRIAVEATDKARPADVTWVEQMVGKHRNLPTDKLVLVSDSGFTSSARATAEAEGTVPIAPEDLAGDPEGRVVGRLRSLWPKSVALTTKHVTIHARPPGTNTLVVAEDPPGTADVRFLGAEEVEATVRDCVVALLDPPQHHPWPMWESLGIAQLTEDRDFEVTVRAPSPFVAEVNGVPRQACLQWRREDDSFELHPIDFFEVVCDCQVRVAGEMPLRHVRLGGVVAAFGETELLGRRSVVVVSGQPSGEIWTVRDRHEGGNPTDRSGRVLE